MYYNMKQIPFQFFVFMLYILRIFKLKLSILFIITVSLNIACFYLTEMLTMMNSEKYKSI